MKHIKQSGFSLISSAMLTVIGGLAIAALLSLHSLTRSAELRSVMVQAEQYQNAYTTFKQQHLALPGDYNRATELWGDSTRNGDGNREISGWETEEAFVWQHLALSRIIATTRQGTTTPDTTSIALGENLPKAKRLQDAGFRLTSTATPLYNKRWGNMLELGAQKERGLSAILTGGVLPGSYARDIDNKMDDGLPDSGSIFALNGTDALNHCIIESSASNTDITRTYFMGSEQPDCRMIFWMK